jgi:hypothetical protein
MLAALLLILAAVAYRIITGLAIISGATWLSNFAPLAAIALCAGAYFPRRYKFAVPFAALLASDLLLDWYYHAPLLRPEMLSRYVAFALVGWIGLLLQHRATWRTLLPASLGASCLFYLITNAVSWLSDPGYAKNVSALWQALTLGLPAYGTTPTWMFFRNSVLSDFFFTALFLACMSFGRRAAAVETRQPLVRAA